MKISKALLGAILVGIAVQTTATSCTKKEVKPQSEQPKNTGSGNHPNPNCEPCPACGMG